MPSFLSSETLRAGAPLILPCSEGPARDGTGRARGLAAPRGTARPRRSHPRTAGPVRTRPRTRPAPAEPPPAARALHTPDLRGPRFFSKGVGHPGRARAPLKSAPGTRRLAPHRVRRNGCAGLGGNKSDVGAAALRRSPTRRQTRAPSPPLPRWRRGAERTPPRQRRRAAQGHRTSAPTPVPRKVEGEAGGGTRGLRAPSAGTRTERRF